MPSVAQNSFVGGELAPSLYGRTDIEKYIMSVRKMLNTIAHPHGGASNRGGTQFVCEVKTSSKKVRLIPFQFSVTQSYILEFGEHYIRVIKDGGQVLQEPTHGVDIVKSSTYKWTASGHGTNEFYCEAKAGGNPSLSEPEGVYYDVPGAQDDMPLGTLGSLAVGEYGWGDNDSLGYNTIYLRITGGVDPDTKADGYIEAYYIYEVVTTYDEADLPTLKFTQSADVLYLTHPSYHPAKLTRTAHDVWTLSDVTFAPSISAPANLHRNSGSGSGTSYVVTAVAASGEESVASAAFSGGKLDVLHWDAVSGAIYYNVYKDDYASGTYGWIGQAMGTTFTEPSAGITADYNTTPPQALDPFSGTGKYPGVCAFFEQRLDYARTNDNPQSIWGSVVGSYDNLNKSYPVKDDDAYNFTLSSRQVNEIRWLVPLDKLIVGTSGAEFRMGPGTNSNTITPSSVDVKQQSQWGSCHILPIVIGNTILFITGSENVIRDLTYNLDVDGYTGNDLTLFANHLFTNYAIKAWAYQQTPDSIIWCVRDDGKMLGITYYREHQVFAWHQHDTDGYFEDVASLKEIDGSDEVYTVVKRTINGSTKRYIERFMPRLPVDGNKEIDVRNAYIVDCGLSYNNPVTITGITKADPAVVTASAHGFSNGDYVDICEVLGMTEVNHNRYKVANKTADSFELQDTSGNDIDSSAFTTYISGGVVRKAVLTVSGLEHLEGKTVAILADGNVIKDKVVTSGAITLTNRASRIHIGLPYTSDIETLDFEYNTEEGVSVQDKIRQVKSVLLRLQNTRGLQVGPTEDLLDEITFRTNEAFDEPTNLFTGDKEKTIEENPNERQGRIFIRCEDPVPFTILNLIARIEHSDL